MKRAEFDEQKEKRTKRKERGQELTPYFS